MPRFIPTTAASPRLILIGWVQTRPSSRPETTGAPDTWFDGTISRPGADGDFTIRSEATADSEGGRAYPINGFMLQETGAVGNRRPVVDAGGDQTEWIRSSSITVQLDGAVSDDGKGDPNGYLAVQWTRTGARGKGRYCFTPGSDIADPCLVILRFREL